MLHGDSLEYNYRRHRRFIKSMMYYNGHASVERTLAVLMESGILYCIFLVCMPWLCLWRWYADIHFKIALISTSGGWVFQEVHVINEFTNDTKEDLFASNILQDISVYISVRHILIPFAEYNLIVSRFIHRVSILCLSPYLFTYKWPSGIPSIAKLASRSRSPHPQLILRR